MYSSLSWGTMSHKLTFPEGDRHGATTMSQSLAQIYLHLVFSTKNRIPYLIDKPTKNSLHAYLATVFQSLKSPSIESGWR